MREAIFITTLFVLKIRFLSADQCKQHLNTLANTQMLFVQCNVKHAVPVTLCESCLPYYNNMTEAYDVLRNDKNCSERYFDRDRMNMISTMQSILTGLWVKAYCEDCHHNNNVEAFETKSKNLDNCFGAHQNEECISCLPNYEDLNNFYNNLDEHNNGKVCYDMQDKMNRTRSRWSKDFKCCKREFKITLYITASISAIVLTILFYSSAFLYGLRRERNHGILDEDEVNILSNESTRVHGEISSPEPAPAPISTSISKRKLRNEMDTDTSTDDYEDTVKTSGAYKSIL